MFDAQLIEAVGALLAEQQTESARAIDAVRGELLEQLAALPTPEPGEPGRDGTDRIMALPRWVKEGESCPANELAWWGSGIWQSVRATSGSPKDDPTGWKCLVPGIASIASDIDLPARQFVIRLQMSDGVCHECRGRMPATELPPDWRLRGWAVLAGDTIRSEDGATEMMALVDGAEPGQPEQWSEYRRRGFRGQKGLRGEPGERGPRGPKGPGLIGLQLVRDGAGQLALMPQFEDPAVEAQPIAIDLLEADPPAGRQVIACWAGQWKGSAKYGRGDVVSADGRLFLSTRADNDTPPRPGASGWEAMT